MNDKNHTSQPYIYELKMKVRDYECDLQGIVNNANYQHYFEHTRHEFLISKGISFSQLHQQGIDVVVVKVEMTFKVSLRPMDEFVSRLYVRKEGARYVFYQAIYRLPDNKLCITAKTDNAVIVNGRLGFCNELDRIAQEYEVV
jgi:acyl-CoA thioester hydrolase